MRRFRALVPRSGDPYLADGVVALLVLAVLYAPLIIRRSDQPGPFSPWAWVLMAASALPLVWRRRFPLLSLLAVVAALFAYNTVRHVPNQPIAWGLLVAAYSLAWSGRRRRQVAVLLTVGLIACVTSRSLTSTMIGVLTTTGAYVLGVSARRREERLQALAHRAGEMERDRALDVARAATAERARIARDMHDILAHAVSLMVVQAEAGPVVVRADPARAERAFDAIAGTGRDAMVQLRRMLGILKEEQDTGVRAPQPTVAGLIGLVEQVGGTTGLTVGLETSGEPRGLPADAEVAAYRIVQEALTNTVKHAAAARATVRLDWTDTELSITVTDDGRGTVMDDGGGAVMDDGGGAVMDDGGGAVTVGGRGRGIADGGGAGTPPGPGNGLIGIRERAAACGGSADAGPLPGGGHRVRATLPYRVPS